MESLSTGTHVENLIVEYQSVVSEVNNPGNIHMLKSLLMSECEWTERGAATIVRLAHQYGSFVLANALALAEVLDIEDGDCGI